MNNVPTGAPLDPAESIPPGRLKSLVPWAPPTIVPLLDDPDLVGRFVTNDFRPRNPVGPIGRILYVHPLGSIVVPIGFRKDGLMDCLLLRGPASTEEVLPLVLVEEKYIRRATELGIRLPDDRSRSGTTSKSAHPGCADALHSVRQICSSAEGANVGRTRFKPPPCDRLDWSGLEEADVEEEQEISGEPPSLGEPRHRLLFDTDLDDPDAVEMIAAKRHQWPPRDGSETAYGKLLYLHERGRIVIGTGNVMQFGPVNALVMRGKRRGFSAVVSQAEFRQAYEVGIYLPDSAKK
ncbi:hypothetical protein B2J88_35915 [Rhodococcus sp. SRB_17]|nr:hypothetical protein [Rhodococcus sp. SRB_17]